MIGNRYEIGVYNSGKKEGVLIGTLIGTFVISALTLTLGLVFRSKKKKKLYITGVNQ